MSRIGATIFGAERFLIDALNQANAQIALSNLRLASGHQLQSPADNPAEFVALSNFQSQSSDVAAALTNVTSASNTVSQAQLALDQIVSQVQTIRQKALDDVGQTLTADERAANQAAIDQAIATIDQLVTTTVNGRRLLDGSADFLYSGANANQVAGVEAYSLGASPSQTLFGTVNSAATQAQVSYTGAAGAATSDATITLTGDRGTTNITVTNGQSLTSLRDAINGQTYATGVTAGVSGNTLTLQSIDYGSRAAIGVEATSGSFSVTGLGTDGLAHGTDAIATINGLALRGNGNSFDVASGGLRATIQFAPGFTGAFAPVTISGTALPFSLSTDVGQKSVLAIPGLQTSLLGGPSGNLAELVTGGDKSGLGQNASVAVQIADEALGKLTRVQGLVDGFANAAISSSAALLNGMQTNLTSEIQSIDGVDSAQEQATISKNQLLAANALAGLAILDQQRKSILALIDNIAGLSGTSGG